MELDPTKSLQSLVGKVIVRSSINPLLWLCGVISLPSLIILAFSNNSNVQIFLAILACLPLLAVFLAYGYFMFKNPDYLRSEKFQSQQHAMDLHDEKNKK